LRYLFEDCVLDTDRRELRRGEAVVPLTPQALDLLIYLIRNRDRVVSKDDLIASVWGGRIVSDAAVTTRINAARSAIGDSGEAQRLIRTLPRKGFRFVGVGQDVESPAGPAADTPSEPPAALALPDLPSIVVLPFANLSGDPAQGYFADGVVEDITLALGRLPGLFVIGSGSAFSYKGQAVDTRRVGAELGVRYVLRGSVRKDGKRVRISAELADAAQGAQIWADRFEGEIDDIFALQDQVAADVSTMIAPALRTHEIDRAARKPTGSLTAYDLFLRASRHYRESVGQNRDSLRLLSKATELDPSYGAAYGLAAHCYFVQKLFGWTDPADPSLAEGLRLAHLAAETGKHDSEALWMAAQTLVFLGGDFERALPLIEVSLSLNPNSPAAYETSSMIHAFHSDVDIALEHCARAQRHNPRDPMVVHYLTSTAYANFYAGRYEEADRAVDRVLSRAPSFGAALRLKIVTCGLLGRPEEGRDYVRRARAAQPWLTVAAMRAFYEVPLRKHPRALEDYLEGLRASGLPEGAPS
jgi:TolB-like protein